nr:HDOD domain-containing protein [Lysobacter sp. CAU 1642]
MGITDLGLACQAGLDPERLRLLLDTTRQHLGGEGGALQLAHAMPLQSLGRLGLYLLSAQDLRELLIDLHRYWPLIQLGHSRLEIGIGSEQVLIGFAAGATPPGEIERFAEELTLAALLRLLRQMLGEAAGPFAIVYPEGSAPRAEWNDLFGVASRGGHSRLALELPASALDLPARTAQSAMRDTLRGELELALVWRREQQSTSRRVLRVLAEQGGALSLDPAEVAAELGLSPVALSNQLRLEGGDFAALLDSVRRERLLHGLLAQETPLEELAAQLGLDGIEELSRQCQRWFQASPSQLRSDALACGFDARRGSAHEVEQLPPAPQTCRALIALRYMEEADLDQIVEVVETDPALTAKIMGLAGSAFYGARKVRDLKDAIGRVLGLNELIRVASVLVAQQSLKPRDCAGFDLLALWTRALATGHALGELLRPARPAVDAEELRLIGLFHELGLQVLAHRAGPQLSALLQEVDPCLDEASLRRAELRRLGTTRHITGSLLLAHWGLPSETVRALRQLDHLLYDPMAEAPIWLRLLAVLSRYFRLRYQGQPVDVERIAIAGLLQRAGVEVEPDSLGTQLDDIMDQRQQQAETLLGA